MSVLSNYSTTLSEHNPQIDDSQLADSRAWVDRAQQTFPFHGITVTRDDIHVTLTAHCSKCHAPISEAFDMDADERRTRYALRVYRDKLTPHSVPLLCYTCRPRPTLLPQSIQPCHASGGGSGGSGRNGKPKPRQSKGERRMTFSMAVEIAGGYGYLLTRSHGGYRVKPRNGGEWVGYATLNSALAAIETAVKAAREAK